MRTLIFNKTISIGERHFVEYTNQAIGFARNDEIKERSWFTMSVGLRV